MRIREIKSAIHKLITDNASTIVADLSTATPMGGPYGLSFISTQKLSIPKIYPAIFIDVRSGRTSLPETIQMSAGIYESEYEANVELFSLMTLGAETNLYEQEGDNLDTIADRLVNVFLQNVTFSSFVNQVNGNENFRLKRDEVDGRLVSTESLDFYQQQTSEMYGVDIPVPAKYIRLSFTVEDNCDPANVS